MEQDSAIKLFEEKKIRTHFDEETEEWYFSVIDVVEVLTNSANPRDYWFKMKQRVVLEDGIELSTICRQLKMLSPDGKMRITDCASTQALLRIIQSIPSPKAEPFKQWLAKVGYERIQETTDPEQSINRARDNWQKLGRSEGNIAKNARQELEDKTGKSVVTGENFLPPATHTKELDK